jgi:hypothetical protein
MGDTRRTWAAWSEDSIHVYRRREDGSVERQSLPRATKADLRYFVTLHRTDDGTLLLRSGDDGRTRLDTAADGAGLRPVEGLPERLASLPPYRVVPFRDGTLGGLRPDRAQLVLWTPGDAPVVRSLPEGFEVRDVDRDADGRLWACGSLPSQRLRSIGRRRALATSDDRGRSWQVHGTVHGGLKVALRSLLSGAETTYRTVDVVGDRVVLSAETEGYGDTSTFLFVRDADGEWRTGTLDDDVLRSVVPDGDGGTTVIGHYGGSVSVPPSGRWRYRDLSPRVDRLVRQEAAPPSDARYEVLDARPADDGARVVVVSVRVPEEGRLVRFGEAVAVLTDDGDRAVAFHGREDPEIVTAV